MNHDVAMVTCGPAEHGIVRFGAQLHAAVVGRGFSGSRLHEPDPHRLLQVLDVLAPTVRTVHLQANDWLFSSPDQSAAQRISAFSTALRSRQIRLGLTLHDLPHPHVDPALFVRRARSYLEMMRQAAAVVVSSDHERLLAREAAQYLTAIGDKPSTTWVLPSVTMIPLPVSASVPEPGSGEPGRFTACSAATAPAAPTVGVLGYLYPGKGHQEILEELAHFPEPIGMLAIGAASTGHEWLLPELIARSRALGIGFSSTGFVPDAELPAHLRAVTVPVAAAAQVSASASINTWIAAGRRPLVLAGRYTRELDARMPGSVQLYEPGQLRTKVTAALAEPSSTHLPTGFRPEPGGQEVARRYLEWFDTIGAGFGTGGSGH